MFGPRVAVAWMFHFQDDNLSRMTCEPAACRNAKVGACGSAKSGKTIRLDLHHGEIQQEGHCVTLIA